MYRVKLEYIRSIDQKICWVALSKVELRNVERQFEIRNVIRKVLLKFRDIDLVTRERQQYNCKKSQYVLCYCLSKLQPLRQSVATYPCLISDVLCP